MLIVELHATKNACNRLTVIALLFIIHTSLTMAPKTVVVTGANRGLGLEIVRQLGQDSAVSKIYALCRKSSDKLNELASDKVSIIPNIDVSRDDCVPILQTTFMTKDAQPIPIHTLIQNAGAYGPPESFPSSTEMYASQTLDNITMDRMRFAFELNTLGPLRVTKALLPNLQADNGGKVIIISSLMGSIADNDSGGHYGYRAAKSAVNQVGKSLSVDLRPRKIAVGLVHPGYVFTGFQGEGVEKQPGQHDVEPSAKGVLEAIESISMENTGSFLHGNYGEGVKPLAW